MKFDYAQRRRIETEILPAVIDDPEYAAAEIMKLEIERDSYSAAMVKEERAKARAIEALEAIQRCYANDTRARVCDTDIAWYTAEGLRTARDGERTVNLSSSDRSAKR